MTEIISILIILAADYEGVFWPVLSLWGAVAVILWIAQRIAWRRYVRHVAYVLEHRRTTDPKDWRW